MIRDTSLRHGRLIRRIAETVGWDQRSAGPRLDRDLVGLRIAPRHKLASRAHNSYQTSGTRSGNVAFRSLATIFPPVRTRIGEVAEWPNAPVC